MANAHREEADQQLAHIERLRVRAKMERPGWGPTPLQSVHHQTGAATGLTFGIETGKYQLGWREKLFFNESVERQTRRKELLGHLKKIEDRIVGNWLKYHELHTNTAEYIKEKQRLENKIQSQKRLDDFRKQFNASLATYQRVGMCPDQYLTRWYTNYMKDLWEKTEVRTFYAGERKMLGSGAVPGRRFAPGPRAEDPALTKILDHPLPGKMNDRFAHTTGSGADAGLGKLPELKPKVFGPRSDFCGPPARIHAADSSAHFMNMNNSVPQQRQVSRNLMDQSYSVSETLPYRTAANASI